MWQLQYRWKKIINQSFWLLPAMCMVLAVIIAMTTRWLDHQHTFRLFNYSTDGARTLLNSLTGSLLTFLVFVISSMLLIVQLASSQLTPRIIAMAFTTRYTQFTLCLFVFTYTFSLATLVRIDDHVPQLSVGLSVLCTLLSIVVFFWFAQKLGTSLRPVSIVQAVCEATRRVIDEVYPVKFSPPVVSGRSAWKNQIVHETSSIVPYRYISGVLVAFDIARLVQLAQQANCTIELIPQVGDFVSKDDPLCRIYPENASLDTASLQQAVIVGSERTIELDPMFGFRIMVDIASRALSAAINDPTTAVMAIDQLHRLLRYVGKRQLSDGTVVDSQGKLRLVYPTPNWEDFTSMAVSEIRQFGISSIQIPRRLRAMLEHLLTIMPEERKPALREELELLKQAVYLAYPIGMNRTRAETSDLQGIGGSAGVRITEEEGTSQDNA
ncbi:MAG: DUF2254 domain-containing protein [Planctomycetia bacterium]|nr:DUF2254 domain-containing protein [Planctomycetia bacterium]